MTHTLIRVGPNGLLADSAGRPLLTTAEECCCPDPDPGPDPDDTPGCSSVNCPLTVSVTATGFIDPGCVGSNIIDIGGRYSLTQVRGGRRWETIGKLSAENGVLWDYFIRLQCEADRPEFEPGLEAWVLFFRVFTVFDSHMTFGRLAFLEQGCPAIGPLPLIAAKFGLGNLQCHDGTIEVLG